MKPASERFGRDARDVTASHGSDNLCAKTFCFTNFEEQFRFGNGLNNRASANFLRNREMSCFSYSMTFLPKSLQRSALLRGRL
jgi:hypothetical protein